MCVSVTICWGEGLSTSNWGETTDPEAISWGDMGIHRPTI